MNVGTLLALFGAMIGVALLTIAVGSPNTAGIINAFGSAFGNSLSVAMGHPYSK